MIKSICRPAQGFFRNGLVTVVLAGAAQSASAGDLFNITANSTAGPPISASASGSSVIDLVNNLINAQNQFSAFNGVPFSAGLRYADVANAITFSATGPGTSATLAIPSTGFSRNFNGATRSDVENQIVTFIKKDGAAELAKFYKAMAAQSLVAVSDGNPNSTTAYSAGQSYENYGMTFAETREEKENPKQSAGRAGFGIVADVGTFSANGIKGTTYSLPLYGRFELTDRVGLSLDVPLSYVDLDGGKIFGVGLGLGLPVKVIPRAKDSPWYWQLTPFGGASASGSKDLVAGGLIANGGLNSLLAYDFGPCTLSMGTHFSTFEGVPITIASYTFDPGVNQQILKNGLKLDVPVGRRWVFDVYGIHTKFIHAAAVNQYATVGGEIGYRLLGKPDAPTKKNGYLKLGVYSDIGSHFTSAHLQAGTGWKF